MTPAEGTQESLQRHLDWLYGPGGVYGEGKHARPCRCEHSYKGYGRQNGIDMGKAWVRTTTHPDCPHHGRGR